MLAMSQVRDHLSRVFPTVPVEIGPDLPEYPGEFLLITPTGGPGLQTDGYTDVHSFQVRAVGDQNDYDSAERLAVLADLNLLRLGMNSQEAFDTWVVSISRSGGSPTVLMRDEAERHHFVASYLVEVDSTL